MKACILAAGYATRLMNITDGGKMPKALLKIKVEGKDITILHYILNKILQVNAIDEVLLVSNKKYFKQFKQSITEYKKSVPKQRKIKFKLISDGSVSPETATGANNAIRLANKFYKKVDDDFLVCAADNYFEFDINDMYNLFKQKQKTSNKATSVVVSKYFPDSKREYMYEHFGILTVDKNGRMLKLEEKPGKTKTDKANHVSLAMYMFDKQSMMSIEDYLSTPNLTKKQRDSFGYFINYLINTTNAFTFVETGRFYDIGTEGDYNIMKTGEYVNIPENQ